MRAALAKKAKETLLRQWCMLRTIPRFPQSVGTRELKASLESDGFHVDVRTLQRDLERLSAVFPLVNEEKGRAYRWFWCEGAKVMDIPGIDPPTALAFRLAEEYLTSLLPQTTLRHLDAHFLRAKEVLAPARGNKLGLWPDKVCLIGRGPGLSPPKIRPAVQDAVYQALHEDRQMEVRYKSKSSRQEKCYPVNPLGLVFRDGVVYLVCTAKDYKEVIHLALHRMAAATVLNTACRRPHAFDLHTYVKGNEEFAYPLNGTRINLAVLFTEQAAVHLSERQLAAGQELIPQKDGHVLLRASVRDTLELRWWLLGFGDNVTVLGPRSLREEFSDIASRMAKLYEAGR